MVSSTSQDVDRSRSDPNRFARELFDGLPRRYDLLEQVLSFGQNLRWRTQMVDAVASVSPRRVLDVATGTAGVALRLAADPAVEVVGIDLTEAMLRVGRQRIGSHPGIHLVAGRAEQLPFDDESFDGLTFTYLLRYVSDPAATMRELVRVVRPGGPIASLEFAVPSKLATRLAWRAYTRAVLPAAGYVGGGSEWAHVGRFLGPSIEEHYRRFPVSDHIRMWTDAGIDDVHVRTMSLGGGLVMWGRRR